MTPTRLIFGENAIEKLHDVMAVFGRKVLLTYGGGSVLDCSKAIAAGAKYDRDPWDLITYKVQARPRSPSWASRGDSSTSRWPSARFFLSEKKFADMRAVIQRAAPAVLMD